MYDYKVVLASQSPRRRELILNLFNSVHLLPVSYVEPEWQSASESIRYLTQCVNIKWQTASKKLANSERLKKCPLLVVDTIVALDGLVLGKPENPAHAVEMLSRLSGTTHFVYSGLCLGQPSANIRIDRRAKTRVKFHRLQGSEIRAYVQSGEPMDKAGAYGFQGLGMKFVAQIEGSYSNVMGLPLGVLDEAARKLKLRMKSQL